MKNSIFLRMLFLLVLLAGVLSHADAQENWKCDENGCAAAIASAEYFGREAWKLSDGKTEAIVVPSLGRMMSFKRVGEENWLWSATEHLDRKPVSNNWKNWGGDKTWLAPQSRWAELGGTASWPPPKEWDQSAFQSEVLSGGKVKIWSPLSKAGLRISRVFYHDENGDFVVEQTVSKTAGAPVQVALWNVTQINGENIDTVFLPRAPGSYYESGFRWLGKNHNATPQSVTPTLLQVRPALNNSYKLGTDAPRAAIAATRGDWALVLKTERPDGVYPDGEDEKSGTPVQLFGTGDAHMNYVELELLSPLVTLRSGERHTNTIRWSVQQLPSADASDASVHAEIEKLLG